MFWELPWESSWKISTKAQFNNFTKMRFLFMLIRRLRLLSRFVVQFNRDNSTSENWTKYTNNRRAKRAMSLCWMLSSALLRDDGTMHECEPISHSSIDLIFLVVTRNFVFIHSFRDGSSWSFFFFCFFAFSNKEIKWKSLRGWRIEVPEQSEYKVVGCREKLSHTLSSKLQSL